MTRTNNPKINLSKHLKKLTGEVYNSGTEVRRPMSALGQQRHLAIVSLDRQLVRAYRTLDKNF